MNFIRIDNWVINLDTVSAMCPRGSQETVIYHIGSDSNYEVLPYAFIDVLDQLEAHGFTHIRVQPS